jgi:hypothetical protein
MTVSLTVNGGSGSGPYEHGNYAPISAQAPAGQHFVNWGNATRCTLTNWLSASTTVHLGYVYSTLPHTASVTAYFENNPPPPSYTISYYAGAGGTISGTTTQTGASGTVCSQVTATPSSGYAFSSWSDGIMTAARTDTISGTTSYTAYFTLSTCVLTVTDGTGSGTYASSSTVNISSSPPSGYHHLSWGSIVNCTVDNYLLGSTHVHLTAGAATASVTASFEVDPPPPTYTLTYSADIGGSISGSASQTGLHTGDSGTEVTAVPDAGFAFLNWSDSVQTTARTDIVASANKSVTAYFISVLHPSASIGTYLMI